MEIILKFMYKNVLILFKFNIDSALDTHCEIFIRIVELIKYLIVLIFQKRREVSGVVRSSTVGKFITPRQAT